MADLQRTVYPHISGHPSAAGRAQDESSPVKDRRSTTVPRNQPKIQLNEADNDVCLGICQQWTTPRVSGVPWRHHKSFPCPCTVPVVATRWVPCAMPSWLQSHIQAGRFDSTASFQRHVRATALCLQGQSFIQDFISRGCKQEPGGVTRIYPWLTYLLTWMLLCISRPPQIWPLHFFPIKVDKTVCDAVFITQNLDVG